ncbi:Crp/Fnr family transcriptional regulator [Rufibacter sp. LB8]|uniref:Crp/Fnr family transcriptional regulator n=1 Tax=Rufibacter sp. LB8 TaxID=2777781 RepID=UPI00178C792C
MRLRKGQLLLVPGHASQSIYFLESGLVRGYSSGDGFEYTRWFAHEGEFLLPDGCFHGAASTEYVEVLEETLAYALPLRQMESLLAEIPQVAHLFLKLLEEKALQGRRREEMLRIASAAERYRYLQSTRQEVVRRVNQEMMASYLNLSPKHLSRLRREEAHGGREKN